MVCFDKSNHWLYPYHIPLMPIWYSHTLFDWFTNHIPSDIVPHNALLMVLCLVVSINPIKSPGFRQRNVAKKGIVNPMALRPHELFDHKTTHYDGGTAILPSKLRMCSILLISDEMFKNPQVKHDLHHVRYMVYGHPSCNELFTMGKWN